MLNLKNYADLRMYNKFYHANRKIYGLNIIRKKSFKYVFFFKYKND